jgi:NADH dehydrogenase
MGWTLVNNKPEFPSLPHIVIIGGGFGGLQAALGLGKVPARITLIDRNNHHVFQPLLYQVATAGLSPADIAAPIRHVLRRQRNTEVLMAEVTKIDLLERRVWMGSRFIEYDELILATGARHSYFGHEEWERYAPGLKTLTDATTIRRKILLAFEMAEMETDPIRREVLMTFVLVGGGPTGVEMAGALAELAKRALACDFRHIDPTFTRILLLEAGPRILSTFPEPLSQKAQKALERMGVTVRTGAPVEHIDAEGVVVAGERIACGTVLWTAGVAAKGVAEWLGAEADRAGRVKVCPDLSVPGHPHVFVIGDAAHVEQDGKLLPGIAPVAMQQGRYTASVLRNRLLGRPAPGPFRYKDKGNLATVGRSFAIVNMGRLQFAGFFAWVFWMAVHIYYLIGFANRLLVMIQWAWAYFTFQRGARLITFDKCTDTAGEPIARRTA